MPGSLYQLPRDNRRIAAKAFREHPGAVFHDRDKKSIPDHPEETREMKKISEIVEHDPLLFEKGHRVAIVLEGDR